jgi:ferrous iron transport protein B
MKIGLIGNPNVGKSLIFQQLTGLGVEVSNYPGTTVDLKRGNLCFQKEKLELVDLPGIYSLDGDSPEEVTVRTFLQEGEAEVLIAVVDAAHLERNLYLLVQLAEFRKPLVVVLNMMDEAEAEGLEIDVDGLGELLSARVIPVIAIQGKNVEKIIPAALDRPAPPVLQVNYDHHVEAAVRSLHAMHGSTRLESLQALQGFGKDEQVVESAAVLADEIEKVHLMSPAQLIAGNRHHCAHNIAAEVTKQRESPARRELASFLTSRGWGPLILVGILLCLLIAVFLIGSFLEGVIVYWFDLLIIRPFLELPLSPLASQMGISLLLALQAGLGIAFPFILIFYILISFLEDSGYLTRAAFLADAAMHRMGMHGQAIIPLVLGLGCSVPAIMSLRLLSTRRERVIASFLVSMIPCSARTVIIAGIVAAFVGLPAALSIYLMVFLLVVLTGLLLSRFTPGDQFGMIMELAPLRKPRLSNVLLKSWLRIREFLVIAMPLLIAASLVLGFLQYAGVFSAFQAMIDPFSTAVLGLPGYATTALVFGILRKEMALETLVILAGTADLSLVLTPVQIYTFALVSVLFIPCISTIGMLYKVVGAKITLLVSAYTVALGIMSGALINILIK